MGNDEAENIDELLDTGKAARMALSMLKDLAPDIKRVREIAEAIDRRTERQERQANGIFKAIWHAFGVFKAEVGSIFKDG